MYCRFRPTVRDYIMGFSTRAFACTVKQCVHDRVCQTFGPSGINAGFPHTSPDGDTIMIQVCLVFGGNNSAQIFDCVGSALERLIQADIAKMAPCTVASVQRYVDYIMGFSTRAFACTVKQCVHDRVCQTFGPSGINAGKSINPA